MHLSDTIYVAGHRGMVGSAIMRSLQEHGFSNIITRTSRELDLRDQEAVHDFFIENKPDIVFLAAARVGGIQANIRHPAEFLYDNLMIQNNVIHSCHVVSVRKVIFLGSSCIYPRDCPQPMKEEYLLTGPLEPTNEGYALAKIAGLKMAEYYHSQYDMNIICPMPCNLYGPNDHFDPVNSHVMSALVKKFVDACEDRKDTVTMWGTGSARREFMHVDDLARALVFLTEHWHEPDIINVGWGKDISIRELAVLIAEKVHYHGEMTWDSTMPDGMPRKCLDVARLNRLGFVPAITLERGIDDLIREYYTFREKSR